MLAGPDGRAGAGSPQQATFPVSRHRASGHIDGAFGNRCTVGQLATSICYSRARPEGRAGLPQHGQQFVPQEISGQHIQRCVNRFSRDVFGDVFRICVAQEARYLVRRADPNQLCGYVLPQARVEEFPDASWAMGSGHRAERLALGQA